jgi:hypothetical protein
LPGQATTGLTSEQFDELVERVGERIVWDYGRGRPRELTLHQAVKAVVMYFRTNVTQELIAELLFVDQSTISRAISDLEEIIAEALDEFVPELPEEIEGRVAIVDGSLCPCWSWADAAQLYSGKHTAPRRRPVVYPTQSGGIGGIFLGLMPNLAPKGQGNNSMAENQCSCPGVWSEALADPRDTVKAELLDTLISSGESPAPTGKTPETGAIPLRRRLVLADATSGGWSDI